MKLTHVLILLLLVTACRPWPDPAGHIQQLPTQAAVPTAVIDLESAQRTAELFLSAWQRADYEAMYSYLSFPAQEAAPFDAFQSAYDDTAQVMRLDSLRYGAQTMLRESERVVVLRYSVTFVTELLGEFTDDGREMRLVLDPTLNAWRVAWSLADIFYEMGNGARLVFQPHLPSRANIYDRDGLVLADQNGVMVQIRLRKDQIPDVPACIGLLASLVDRPQDQIRDLLDRSGSDWIVDVGLIDPGLYADYRDQLVLTCDAAFSRVATRRYLRGSLMPHILGNVGYPEPDEIPELERAGFNQATIIGKSGIEASWDETLRGGAGGQLSLLAPDGGRLRLLTEAPSRPAESLWLTVDADLQEYLIRTLGEAYIEAVDLWAATSRGASAVVLEPDSGQILAMASWPTYEGNALNPFPAVGREVANEVQASLAQNERVPQLHRPTLGIYPAGSLMKVVDAIAVADSGIYPSDRPYVCTGVWERDNDRRFDWLTGGHGTVTIPSALTQSCNPFFYEVGYQMNSVDPYLLPNYAKQMGLGDYTGMIDMAESPGLIPDPDWIRVNRGQTWTFSHAVSMAIGQGEVQVTPLQMARLYAAIANGGTLYRPQLVHEAGILDQRRFIANADANGQFGVAPDVLQTVRDGLCAVTSERAGTASHVFRDSPLLNLGICAKTGTAQAAGQDAEPHSWFAAWGPAEQPQVVVVVMVENSGEGSAVAAPLARRILEYYFFGPFDDHGQPIE